MDFRAIGLRRLRITGAFAIVPVIVAFGYDATRVNTWQQVAARLALIIAAALGVEICAQAGARAVGRDASYLVLLTPLFGTVVFWIVMFLLQTYKHEPIDTVWLGAMLPSGIVAGLAWGIPVGCVASALIKRRQ